MFHKVETDEDGGDGGSGSGSHLCLVKMVDDEKS